MGNRSRYAAATAAAAAAMAVAVRRRARIRRAMEGTRDAILPSHVSDIPTAPSLGGDEAHAPGHSHLGPPLDRPEVRGAPGRARARYSRGMRQRLSDR